MNLSRAHAVKRHCKECAGPDNGNRSTNLCTASECYLWPFRSGTPHPAEVETHLQKRAAMDERNRLMRRRTKKKIAS